MLRQTAKNKLLAQMLVLMLLAPFAMAGVKFNIATYTAFPKYTVPSAVAVADFDRDGHMDFAVADAGDAGCVTILFGNGDGTFRTGPSYAIGGGSGPTAITTGDFNQDGITDLLLNNFADFAGETPQLRLLLGNPDGTFQAPLVITYSANTHPTAVVAADLNGDGKLDVVAANLDLGGNGDASFTVLLGNGDGTFGPPMETFSPAFPDNVAVGDLNQDGKPDLIVAANTETDIYLGNGDGTFQLSASYPGHEVFSVAVGDFNGDAKPDVAASVLNGVEVLLGNGDGTFAAPVQYTTGGGDGVLTLADVDGDGLLDIVGAAGNQLSVLLGNGDGTFGAALTRTKGVGSGLASIATGDFDQDGKIDLVTADQLSLDVAVYLNRTIAVPKATVFPTKLTFGAQKTGTTSPPLTATFTNSGDAPLNITSISVINPEFTLTDNCGAVLQEHKSCTLTVTFRPTHTGIRTGKITISDNAAGSPQKIALQGTGD